ncbi:MAG: PQQ-binding-like beta-propeller repeat protein [Candidatus Hydrogenedentes bacterium]|nr:PQQ-binding-like beta-propeller repeat protein [Candidatus Hydrogenedentota bacterium]
MVELGSGWNRFNFNWNAVEREKGVFNFDEYQRRVAESLANGVKILPILDGGLPWGTDAAPADEEALVYWERYVERTVTAFKGKLEYWQAWNEPNIGFWNPTPNPRDYAELLRRTALAAKRANPDAKIVGLTCSGIDLEFTEAVFRYGGLAYCDVLAYQPYRIAPEVGHFEEMRALHELVSRYGGQRPIWITEMGWDTANLPFRDADQLSAERPMRRQAAFLVRYMVLLQAAGVEKAFWFNQGAAGYGLCGENQEKRLSFNAYQHLIRVLSEYRTVKELHPRGANGIYAYLFECPNDSVVVAWSVNGTQKLALPGLTEARELRNMLGLTSISLSAEGHLPISGEPVYVFFSECPAALKDRASVTVEPSQLWLSPGESAAVTVRCAASESDNGARVNRLAGDGGLRVPRSISLAPSEEKTFVVKASVRTRYQQGVIEVRSGGDRWPIEVNVAPRLMWTYEGKHRGYLKPALHLDREGRPTILVASTDGPELLCLSASGALEWAYDTGAPVCDSVTSRNIHGGPEPEIILGVPGASTVEVLSGDGVLRWRQQVPIKTQRDVPTGRWTRPEVGDLDGDGQCEIVSADAKGGVTVLKPDGSLRWYSTVSAERCDRPIGLGDVCGEGNAEILVGDEKGMLHCLSPQGEVLWKTDLGATVTTDLLVYELVPGAGRRILAGLKDERLVCLTGAGELLWTAQIDGTMDIGAGLMTYDLNLDGEKEIVLASRNHQVLAFAADGRKLWRVETGAQVRCTPAIGDVDGDGESEIIIGCADWRIYAISHEGAVRWTVNVGSRIDSSILLADINGDGILDIIAPLTGNRRENGVDCGGKIAVFTSKSDNKGRT